MLHATPFQGYRFQSVVTGNLDNVITPPYDVIDEDQRAQLAAASPYNMVHLLLPQAANGRTKYEEAVRVLEAWIAEGALKQDDMPSFYLLRQHFTDLDGNAQVRRGFFAAVKIPEPDERYILGHERTFDKPVEDRLALTAATQSNPGPIFGLYNDPDGALQPFLDQMNARHADASATTADGVQQELWRVDDVPTVNDTLQGQMLYIADGHHRFLTAQSHRDNMRKAHPGDTTSGWNYVLTGLVAFDDPGLKIYPPHRVVQRPDNFDATAFKAAIEQWFHLEPAAADLPAQVAAAPGECVMGICIADDANYLATLKDIDRAAFLGSDRGPAWRNLDVALLHRGILENILGFDEKAVHKYEKDIDAAIASVSNGSAGLAFILRATRPDQMCACAEAGEPMPPKSTYFFPKLPSGGVIYRHV